MRYRVEYETSTRPVDLPAGATVTEVGPVPLEFMTRTSNRRFTLTPMDGSDKKFFLKVFDLGNFGGPKEISSILDADELRTLGHAFLEAVGDPASSDPQLIKDGDGDYWMVQGSGYVMCNMDGDRFIDSTVQGLSFIADQYDGYTVIR